MSGIYGALGLPDGDMTFVNVIGQRAVFDAANKLMADYTADLNAAIAMFVEQNTTDFKWRYMLPGGGRLQKRGGSAKSGQVKAYGSWDVAFPLDDFGEALGGSDVALAYMTVQQLNRHLDNLFIRDANTVRFELLKALFNNAEDTYLGVLGEGTVYIEPLANGDSVTYPPVIGSETEATEDHYLGSAYLASAISDTNDPFVTLMADLKHHNTDADIVAFINNAQWAKARALTDMRDAKDAYIVPGANQDVVMPLPATTPGQVRGRHAMGCWVVEWNWIPAGWIMALDLNAPKPLIQRIDKAESGLGTGLQLVSQNDDYPLSDAQYRHRFGFGVGNRLNGAIMDLSNADSDYDVPSAYA
jgi:hypothetical protein